MFVPYRLHCWAIACMCCTVSASAQADFYPLGTINADMVAAGGRTIWAVSKDTSAPRMDTFLFNPQSFLFESRQPQVELYPAKMLATGGGNIFQTDESWANFPQNGMYRFDAGTQQWMKYPYDGADPRIQNIVVGVGYSDNCHPYEVWVERKNFTTNFNYLSRYDYCAGLFYSDSGSFSLNRVAVGGGEVWALDASDRVYRFDGVAKQFNLMPGVLSQVAVGVDGVWGIDGSGQAFEFNAITQSWDTIAAPVLDGIWAGGDGVFARKCLPPPVVTEGATLRRAPASAVGGLRPCGNQLKGYLRYEPMTRKFVDITTPYQIDGLSVGTGAGVLGILPALREVMLWIE
jgi:hypothetical protein